MSDVRCVEQAQPTQEPESQPRPGGLSWAQAGVIVFSFAAPNAIMSVPYAIGMAGFLGGTLICLVLTSASIAGALMLLEVKLTFPNCKTFGELGGAVLGKSGAFWGNVIQLGDFCLFLPCALKFNAMALKGIGQGLPGFEDCMDYYVLVIALACLLTTQARTLNNTRKFTCISLLCVFGMAATQVLAAFENDGSSGHRVPAQLFGNPEPNAVAALVRLAGGFTIGAWSFVPSFITVELADSMADPRLFRKSLLMAGGLNLAMFLGVREKKKTKKNNPVPGLSGTVPGFSGDFVFPVRNLRPQKITLKTSLTLLTLGAVPGQSPQNVYC